MIYAKEWGAHRRCYGDAEADARLRATLTDWCVRDSWFATPRPDCRLMHCLPVRRNIAVADEVLDGPRSIVQREAHNRLTVQMAVLYRMLKGDQRVIMHRTDQTAAIRALKSAAPYIRMYKGKTFVVKAGGGVFGNAALTHSLIEQISILHYMGVRVVMVHGGGPQVTEVSDAMGVRRRWCRAGA